MISLNKLSEQYFSLEHRNISISLKMNKKLKASWCKTLMRNDNGNEIIMKH